MDSITQFVLGAGVGEAVLGKKIGNKALLWGGLAGTIPDLDVVLYPFLDEVGRITVHRGISHSIFFAIFAGLFFGWLFYNWYQKSPDNNTTLKDWALLFGLGFLTHSLLDAFTVYGTQLFLPFSDYRVGFNSIFIVDPIYTVPFILSIIVCSFLERTSKMRRIVSIAGLAFSTTYLCLTLVNKSFADDAFEAAMVEQKIPYTRYMSS
ncbi:MAG: metal-dependent hydrolase, partial [Chitinophagales bacterium]